jgi:hypothetical protein
MSQYVTRDAYERRFQQRAADEVLYRNYQSKIRSETMDRVHQETDARAAMRQKMSRQRIADQEFEIAERLYRLQHEQDIREREAAEQDAIAQALHDQEQAEVRDQKYRGVLRENDPEYRELKSKLQMALISQTRDNQRRELAMRRQTDEQERLQVEEQMMRAYRLNEAQRAEEEAAKHAEAITCKGIIQDQMRDAVRRRQLAEVAQAERDQQEIDAIMSRIAAEDKKAIEDWRRSQAEERQRMIDFMDARRIMKAEEDQAAAEELAKLRAFNVSVDERLARAIEDQKRREQQRAKIAQRIALEVKRKKDEQDAYENMCLELAKQQELKRLDEREEAERRKLERQHAECKKFMEDTMKARAEQARKDREDELKLQKIASDQQMRLAKLAEIEQE